MFRELRRKNKQIPLDDCIAVLKNETRGVLSVLGDDGYPYGMPMNHWYDESDGCIYFHSGRGGHRQDALTRHDKASFCVYDKGSRAEGEWAFKVKSVVVFGRVEFIDDTEKVIDITTRLSHKFTQDDGYIQKEIERSAHKTVLLKLTPEQVCGKLVSEE